MISLYKLKSEDAKLLSNLKYEISKQNKIKFSNKKYNQIEKDKKYLTKEGNTYILLKDDDKQIGYFKFVKEDNGQTLEEAFLISEEYKEDAYKLFMRMAKDYLLKYPFYKLRDNLKDKVYGYDDLKSLKLADEGIAYVIVSYKASEGLVNLLRADGFKVITSYKNKSLDENIDDHPDLQVFKLNENTLICDKKLYLYYRSVFDFGINIITTELNIEKGYPHDCRLNNFLAKDYVFANPKAVDPIVLRETSDKKLVSIKQGYAKCSTVVINCDTIITSDKGIYKKSLEKNLDAYLIEQGNIRLEGYDYGFIGGTCGYRDKKLYFYGNLEGYAYKDDLMQILDKYDIECKYPKDCDFRDLGSIIFI
ncbi:MAG: hypothetical protein SPI59_03370 [Finegoldia sp.]|nr:hypothetical protein [Finegoldia sp.]